MKMEKSKMQYRRATINDIETLIEYRMRFLNEIYGNQPKEKTETLRKSLRQYFSEAIRANNFIAWLAEREGKPVGTGGMVVWQIPGRYMGLEAGRLGYILDMYTIPEARRTGVCARLLEELIREARQLGLKYLHLHASKDGIDIYRKAGFVEPENPELVLRL